MVLVISYDLRAPGRNYDSLYDAIKAQGSWCHPLDSFWLLDTQSSVATMRDNLKKHVDANDGLIVIRAQHDWASFGISQDCMDWLKDSKRSW